MTLRKWGRALAVFLVALAALGGAQATETQLEGSRWAIVEIYGEPLAQDEAPHVTFEARRRLSGRTACNWFHGTYALEADALVLLTRLTTLRGCEVGRTLQRDPTLEALDSAMVFAVTGRSLILSDAGGEPVVRLERLSDE